jgi:hypothetical protein
MGEIGMGAATLAEIGLRAHAEGDLPRAVWAFASISTESWQALGERFPGFPAALLESGTLPIELAGHADHLGIEA